MATQEGSKYIPGEAAGLCYVLSATVKLKKANVRVCSRKIRKPTWEISKVVALCTPFLS
jgi:hypothetical protein